jgi:hypothetical protein
MDTQTTNQLITLLTTLLGGGVGITFIAHATRKYAKIEGKVLHTLVVALSVGAGVLQYIYQFHSSLPPAILGVSVPALYGYSQLLYKYVGYLKKYSSKFQLVNTSTTGITTADSTPVAAPTIGAEPTF